MTLILTWLFPFGIFMGADSAISYDTFLAETDGREKREFYMVAQKYLEFQR